MRPVTLLAFGGVVALTACTLGGPEVISASEGGTSASSTADTAPTTGTGHTPTTSTTGAPSESSTTLATTSTGETRQDMTWTSCDPQAQDCPVGQKCAPFGSLGGLWDEARCVPVVENPALPGEPCVIEGDYTSGIDNCGVGHICWTDDIANNKTICAPLCSGSLDDPVCPPGHYCLVFSEILTVCEVPTCDPLLQDCPKAGELCIPNEYVFEDWCFPNESGSGGQVHDPCESWSDCDKGLACMPPTLAAVECDQEGKGCCQPFCEIGVDTCPGAGQDCLPYFPHTTAGICRLP